MDRKRLLYFIRNYRFQSLFIRNLLLILALTFVPFAVTGLVVYKEMNKIVQEEISSVNLNSLYRISDIVDRIIKQTDLMATKHLC
jgi:two-component system sensor histidine kinase YesM